MNPGLKTRSARFFRILIGILGFSTACEQGMYLYGMPVNYATFVVKGNVKAEKNNGNVPGILVKINEFSSLTDALGNYRLEVTQCPCDQVFPLEFRDRDSIINREYSELDTSAVFTDPVFSGGNGEEYKGKAELIINVKLKDKE